MPEPISIAATHDKQPFLAAAAERTGHGGPDSPYRFRYYSDSDVLRSVAGHDFRYFCPSSAFSLPELDLYLEQTTGPDERGDIGLVAFAATPVVLLMHPEVYAAAVRADDRVGWRTLLSSDTPGLMHAHAGSADGLAVLAAMATAAGDAPELRLDAWEAGHHDEFVHALQSHVMEYAPDDAAIIERGLPDGQWRAHILALQERSAYAALARYPELPAVLVHPADGTAWAHCVLGRMGPSRPREEAAVAELTGALRAPGMSQVYASHALRPLTGTAGTSAPPAAGPHVRVVGSPGVPPAAPPARRLMRTLRKRGASLKRSANVCLVLDTSGSMAGGRLSAAKRGLTAFLDNLEGPDANACVIFFAGRVDPRVPLRPVAASRAAVRLELDRVGAGGFTALLDAVSAALDVLDRAAGAANLQAVVALTDGEENASARTAEQVERRLRDADVLFFGIAYGDDAGRALLERLARSCGGHSLVTDEYGIQAAYELISRHL
jgi:Mg-chelatase subunit ChlD